MSREENNNVMGISTIRFAQRQELIDYIDKNIPLENIISINSYECMNNSNQFYWFEVWFKK